MNGVDKSLDVLTEADGIGDKTLEVIKQEFNSLEELSTLDEKEISQGLPKGHGYTTAVKILTCLQENNLRNDDKVDRELEKLVELLEDLFYFDKEDQDFGVPKLMNQRRERLEQFIDEDLIETVHASIEEMEQNISESELEEAREEVINEINEDAIKPNGEIAEEYKDSDISSVREVVENYQEKKEQAEEIEERENARAEVYNHIYQFFNRYYDKGDFITQRYRTQHEPPYSVPYDGSNTNFHWVTKNQYYAKTSEESLRFSFKVNSARITFLTKSDTYDGDTIGDDTYFVMEDLQKKDLDGDQIYINFHRRSIGQDDLERTSISKSTQNKQESMNEAFAEELNERLSASDVNIGEEEILDKLNTYTSKNERDFFIHKNLESFLENEAKNYLKSNILTHELSLDSSGIPDVQMQKAKVFQDISTKIISFLAQVEEFKKQLFEKKKFVTNSSELIPIKEIPEEHYDKIINCDQQLEEWKSELQLDIDELDKEDLEQDPHAKLLVDTSLCELPESITGQVPKNLLIKSGNYQALSLLEKRYKNDVDAVYIDPPYNVDGNFAYKDSYESASWLAMMYDRLALSRDLLKDEGAIFVSIDDEFLDELTQIMSEIFGEENHVATVPRRTKKQKSNDAEGFAKRKDYVLVYSNGKFEPNNVPLDEEYIEENYTLEDERGRFQSVSMTVTAGHQSGGYRYTVETPGGRKVNREWLYPEDSFQELREDNQIYFGSDGTAIPRKKRYAEDAKSEGTPPADLFLDFLNTEGRTTLQNMFDNDFDEYTPKPVSLIKQLFRTAIDENNATVIDFFAGTGTTAQAALELQEEKENEIEVILVELLQEAFEISKQRIKKLSLTTDWSNGEPQFDEQQTLDDIKSSNSVDVGRTRYLELESYESALDSVDFGEEQSGLSQHTDYLLNYMLEFETVSASLMKTGVDRENDIFSKPLEYKLNRDAQKDTTTDLMTTFNYLLGLRKVEYEQTEIEGTDYSVYRGVMDDDQVLVIWRHDASEVEDYETEREEFDTEDYDHIYVNGDSAISGAKLISSAFKRKMFGGE
jgi:adenine-specific DNA-methyltransferase